MRNAFADEVLNLAEEDDNLVVLSADTGNRLFDEFKNRFFFLGTPPSFFQVSFAAIEEI